MSSIYRYFFPSKPEVVIKDSKGQVNETIHNLNESLAILTTREILLQQDITSNKTEAKERLKLNDKNNAQLYLMKVKMLEGNLSETISNKFNLSAQIAALQNSSFTNQLVSNMEQTRATFRAVSQNRDPVYVKSLVKDVTEEMNRSASIQNSIAKPLLPVGDITNELVLLQAEIDQEREIEQDLALLEMPSAPLRDTPSQPIEIKNNQSFNKPVRQGPRVLKIMDGKVIDSKY